MAFVIPVPVCDPHFHVWDAVARPNANLGGIVDTIPEFTTARFLADAAGLDLRSAVHVETVVGQEPGGFPLDTVSETKEVLRQTPDFVGADGARKLAIVAFVHLGQEDAAAVIAAHKAAAGRAFVGVRMILNYSAEDPGLTWPQVGRGDYLTHGSATFDKNFPLLEANGLAFDLHANWFQLEDAAKFVAGHPTTRVVVDHLGVLKLGKGDEEDAARIALWRKGMAALAALPNVHVKISGLDYIRHGWAVDAGANAVVKGLVREVVALFGASRCMFASNFPVDLFSSDGVGMVDTYKAFHALVDDLPLADRAALFHGTAERFYGLDKW